MPPRRRHRSPRSSPPPRSGSPPASPARPARAGHIGQRFLRDPVGGHFHRGRVRPALPAAAVGQVEPAGPHPAARAARSARPGACPPYSARARGSGAAAGAFHLARTGSPTRSRPAPRGPRPGARPARASPRRTAPRSSSGCVTRRRARPGKAQSFLRAHARVPLGLLPALPPLASCRYSRRVRTMSPASQAGIITAAWTASWSTAGCRRNGRRQHRPGDQAATVVRAGTPPADQVGDCEDRHGQIRPGAAHERGELDAGQRRRDIGPGDDDERPGPAAHAGRSAAPRQARPAGRWPSAGPRQSGASRTGSVKPAKQPAEQGPARRARAGPSQSPSRANQGAPAGPGSRDVPGPEDRQALTGTQPRAAGISPPADPLAGPEADGTGPCSPAGGPRTEVADDAAARRGERGGWKPATSPVPPAHRGRGPVRSRASAPAGSPTCTAPRSASRPRGTAAWCQQSVVAALALTLAIAYWRSGRTGRPIWLLRPLGPRPRGRARLTRNAWVRATGRPAPRSAGGVAVPLAALFLYGFWRAGFQVTNGLDRTQRSTPGAAELRRAMACHYLDLVAITAARPGCWTACCPAASGGPGPGPGRPSQRARVPG